MSIHLTITKNPVQYCHKTIYTSSDMKIIFGILKNKFLNTKNSWFIKLKKNDYNHGLWYQSDLDSNSSSVFISSFSYNNETSLTVPPKEAIIPIHMLTYTTSISNYNFLNSNIFDKFTFLVYQRYNSQYSRKKIFNT